MGLWQFRIFNTFMFSTASMILFELHGATLKPNPAGIQGSHSYGWNKNPPTPLFQGSMKFFRFPVKIPRLSPLLPGPEPQNRHLGQRRRCGVCRAGTCGGGDSNGGDQGFRGDALDGIGQIDLRTRPAGSWEVIWRILGISGNRNWLIHG